MNGQSYWLLRGSSPLRQLRFKAPTFVRIPIGMQKQSFELAHVKSIWAAERTRRTPNPGSNLATFLDAQIIVINASTTAWAIWIFVIINAWRHRRFLLPVLLPGSLLVVVDRQQISRLMQRLPRVSETLAVRCISKCAMRCLKNAWVDLFAIEKLASIRDIIRDG